MEDVLHNVFILLEIKDVLSCMLVNKLWHNMCNSREMWIILFRRDYGNKLIVQNAHNSYISVYKLNIQIKELIKMNGYITSMRKETDNAHKELFKLI